MWAGGQGYGVGGGVESYQVEELGGEEGVGEVQAFGIVNAKE